MRRFKQQLPDAEVRQILTRATHGVLSLADEQGTPYGVPMSFVYDGGRTIYFHGARAGHKMECLRSNSRASFCVVALDEVQPAEFTTYYRSAVVSGGIAEVTGHDERMTALRMLGDKYAPGHDSRAEIAKGWEQVAVVRLEIETMSGKEAIELTRQRQ